MKVTSKMLGDAGEHYALSQFTLAGYPASKMPDNWEGYDLAVESGKGLLRVSVKTRKDGPKWSKGNWFLFELISVSLSPFESNWNLATRESS